MPASDTCCFLFTSVRSIVSQGQSSQICNLLTDLFSLQNYDYLEQVGGREAGVGVSVRKDIPPGSHNDITTAHVHLRLVQHNNNFQWYASNHLRVKEMLPFFLWLVLTGWDVREHIGSRHTVWFTLWVFTLQWWERKLALRKRVSCSTVYRLRLIIEIYQQYDRYQHRSDK